MYNDDTTIIEDSSTKTLSIIKEIDILMEREKDNERITEMLLLREELVQSVEKLTRGYFPVED